MLIWDGGLQEEAKLPPPPASLDGPGTPPRERASFTRSAPAVASFILRPRDREVNSEVQAALTSQKEQM